MKNLSYFSIFIIFSFLSFLYSNAFGYIEASIGTDLQLDVATNGEFYSWDLSGQGIWEISYPFLIGSKIDYQDNFQRIAIISGVRLCPDDWPFKIDALIGGGLASINQSPFNSSYFTFGVEPKYFMNGSIIYCSCWVTDIEADENEYDFVNLETGIGFYF